MSVFDNLYSGMGVALVPGVQNSIRQNQSAGVGPGEMYEERPYQEAHQMAESGRGVGMVRGATLPSRLHNKHKEHVYAAMGAGVVRGSGKAPRRKPEPESKLVYKSGGRSRLPFVQEGTFGAWHTKAKDLK